MKMRRSKMKGFEYSAIVCPACDTIMGQMFISCIRTGGPPQRVPASRGPTARQTAKTEAEYRAGCADLLREAHYLLNRIGGGAVTDLRGMFISAEMNSPETDHRSWNRRGRNRFDYGELRI